MIDTKAHVISAPRRSTIEGQDETGRTVYKVDLAEAHLAIKTILKERKKKNEPTENIGDWIEDFVTWLTIQSSAPITTTQALFLVETVNTEMYKLKQKLRHRTEVSFWFPGVNVNELTDEEVQVYIDDLPRLQSEREMQDRRSTSKLDYDRVKALMLDITGDEEEAEKIASEYVLNQMKNNGEAD